MLANNKIGGIKNSDKLIKTSRKLLKTRKLLKGQKLFKFQKLAKSEKKLSKNGNLSKFNAKKNKPSFITFEARIAFNYL